MLLFLLFLIDDPEKYFLDKICPALVSAFFVISLFAVGRILDSALRAREIRRNWYQKVILDPNLEKINTFYSELRDQIKISIDNLVTNKSLPFDDYISFKAIELNKIKESYRRFESEFIMLVQVNFPEIAEDLSSYIRDLEDSISSFLDKNDLTRDDFTQIEKMLITKKHFIYGILYKPLEFKKPSFKLWKRIKILFE